MSTPVRKSEGFSGRSKGEKRFPQEAYRYEADVTPEGVEVVRKRASKVIDSEEWEVIDGFGLTVKSST